MGNGVSVTIYEFILARVDDVEAADSNAPDVLADCMAKRKIVVFAQWAEKIADPETPGSDPSYRLGQWHGYKAVLREIAGIWSGHADYEQEWADL